MVIHEAQQPRRQAIGVQGAIMLILWGNESMVVKPY